MRYESLLIRHRDLGRNDHIGLCGNVFDDGQIIYRMFLRIDAETHKVEIAAIKLIAI